MHFCCVQVCPRERFAECTHTEVDSISLLATGCFSQFRIYIHEKSSYGEKISYTSTYYIHLYTTVNHISNIVIHQKITDHNMNIVDMPYTVYCSIIIHYIKYGFLTAFEACSIARTVLPGRFFNLKWFWPVSFPHTIEHTSTAPDRNESKAQTIRD